MEGVNDLKDVRDILQKCLGDLSLTSSASVKNEEPPVKKEKPSDPLSKKLLF